MAEQPGATNGQARERIARAEGVSETWMQFCRERHDELRVTLKDIRETLETQGRQLTVLQEQTRSRSRVMPLVANVVSATIGAIAALGVALLGRGGK